jgi:hypothetical protein
MDAYIHVHSLVGFAYCTVTLFFSLSSLCDCDSLVSTEFFYINISRLRGAFILKLMCYSFLIYCIYIHISVFIM